ncbi:Efflux pump apf11 [Cladobotryum mycophilum]|uniref:Efflux pump apf11 n=1 Tax=Cladobotryum mycophilum TaxID=491253 RepID=A0ABR0SCF6_9HYPO
MDAEYAASESTAAASQNLAEPHSPKMHTGTGQDGRPRERLSISEGDEDDQATLSNAARVMITIALGMAILVAGLDATIVGTLAPTLADEFNAVGSVGWYDLLVNGATQPSMGKLYVNFKPKVVLLCSIGLLELGSLICAVAHDAPTFIGGRAVAGLGCSGIAAGALIITGSITPLSQRPMYMGILGALESIAIILGPILGGAITGSIGWRWCFWINLPIGIVFSTALLLFFESPKSMTKNAKSTLLEKIGQVDIIGGIGIAGSLSCLFLALEWAGSKYAWNSPAIIALFVVFVVSFTLVGIHQNWRGEAATFPVRLFKNKAFVGYLFMAFCLASSQFVTCYYLPTWFQTVQGVSPAHSGVQLLPLLLAVIVGAVLGGAGSAITGYVPPFLMLATILGSIGAGLLHTLTPGIARSRWIGYEILLGLGTGMGGQQAIVGIQAAAGPSDVAYASSAVLLMNMLGGSIFICVGQNLFLQEMARVAHQLKSIDKETLMSGFGNIKDKLSPEEIKIAVQGYNDGTTHVFTLVLVLCCLSSLAWPLLKWNSIKGKKETTIEDAEKESLP